jgi:hypothetical protein
MKTLIALFSNTWDTLIQNEGFDNTESSAGCARFIAAKWENLLADITETEVAVFHPSMANTGDYFPSHYRRFIQVGHFLEDRIRNVFELCFEKGYQQVLFVDSAAAFISAKKIKNFISHLDSHDLVFVPSETGSVHIAGMQLNVFPVWDSFQFYQDESVVEMLSDCIRHNVSYSLEPVIQWKESVDQLWRVATAPKPSRLKS